MENKYIEFSDDDICPCGKGQVYSKCCKRKKIKYYYDGGNIIQSTEVELDNVIKEDIEKLISKQREYYGRDLDTKDKIFAAVPNYRDKAFLEIMKGMRSSGIEERYIYASYKMGGLLPNEKNLDFIPDIELEEFNKYCEEFDELLLADFKDSQGVNIVQYVLMVNEILHENINYTDEALNYVLNDFINRHSNEILIENYDIKDELDYLLFLILRVVLVLEGALKLKIEDSPEIIYTLSRSLFENYLYIYNINNDNTFFYDKLFPKVDVKNYEFPKNRDGSVNYNKVISKETGQEKVIKHSIYDLTKKLDLDEDIEIYNIFYKTASRYVHIDIVNANSYFLKYNPYDEINPTYISLIILHSLSCMILEEVSKNRFVQDKFKKDAHFLLKNLKVKLVQSLSLIIQDKENLNEMYEVFKKRIELIKE